MKGCWMSPAMHMLTNTQRAEGREGMLGCGAHSSWIRPSHMVADAKEAELQGTKQKVSFLQGL